MASQATTDSSRPSRIGASDIGLLLLRLAVGIVFVAHGSQKVLGAFDGPGLPRTVAMFGHMGIPAPLAYLAAFTEFLGGLGLIFGVLSRLSALGIATVMVVAILKVHLANGFFMNWAMVPGRGEGYEYHLLVIGMTLALLLCGPGRLAIADVEARLLSGKTG
ncbi:MAG: DoxX family protein [Chthonomonadales bacterium]